MEIAQVQMEGEEEEGSLDSSEEGIMHRMTLRMEADTVEGETEAWVEVVEECRTQDRVQGEALVAAPGRAQVREGAWAEEEEEKEGGDGECLDTGAAEVTGAHP